MVKNEKLSAEDRITMHEFDTAWGEFFKDKPKPRNVNEDKKQQEEFHNWYNNVRKQSDTGKSPFEMGSRIMNFSWDDSEDDEKDFIQLQQLLIPNTEKIQKLKSIKGTIVEEYAGVLGPIESSIAEYFLDHQNLIDEDVEMALKNFIKNPFQEFDYKNFPLENEIQFAASIGAQNKKISLHELKLCIDFIIFSIDNRNYLLDEQAYLKWVCAFLGYLDEKDIKKIENQYHNFGNIVGASSKDVTNLIKTLHPDTQDEESNQQTLKRKIGRNEPCPCGSGIKYKKCCLNKNE